MELSIIIVNWNTEKQLKWCLNYIYQRTKGLKYEIFVVDNASEDGSVEMVEKNYPEVKLIKNRKNLGFAKANNKAIKKAKGKYVLLLNSDTKVMDLALNQMVKYMDNHNNCGVLGCKLLNPDKTLQPSCRRFPNLKDQVIILLKLHNIFPNLKAIREYYMLDFNHEIEMKVDQVMGACFMIRKKVIDKIGLLDDNYFIWFEEVDYCKRVKEAGFDVCFMPYAEVMHEKAASFNQLFSFKKQRMMNDSMLRYFKKHESIWSYLIILLLYPISLHLALLVQIFNKIKPFEKDKKL